MYMPNLIENKDNTHKMSRYTCAAVLMLVVSAVFFAAGITVVSVASYTLGVSEFGGNQILQGSSLKAVYALLATGIIFIVTTLLTIYASCNPEKVFSKTVLALTAILTTILAITQLLFVVVGLDWIGVVNVNITDADGNNLLTKTFNTTVEQIEILCCTNTSNILDDVCNIDSKKLIQDCGNYEKFYNDVVSIMYPILKGTCIALGVTAFIELLVSITSCKLLCISKRVVAYYKPNPEHSSEIDHDSL